MLKVKVTSREVVSGVRDPVSRVGKHHLQKKVTNKKHFCIPNVFQMIANLEKNTGGCDSAIKFQI